MFTPMKEQDLSFEFISCCTYYKSNEDELIEIFDDIISTEIPDIFSNKDIYVDHEEPQELEAFFPRKPLKCRQ